MTARVSSSARARRHKRINCPEITTYMRMVETGKVRACAEQHQLMAHLRRVFADEELIIDTERLAEYRHYEKYFPFDLFSWEHFAFTLFMCVFNKDGTPRWSQELVYMGRGGGKNGFCSFIAFCSTTKVNGIRDYDVDICANSEDQAKTSFDDIWNILENSGQRRRFQKGFRWNKEEIVCRSTNSRIKYRTDNPKSKDGLRSGMVIFDEVHAYQNFDNIKVFTTGLGKKPHPRRLYITTDGDVRDGVLDSLLDKSRRILSGEIPDNGFLPLIFKLDTADEVSDKRNWVKANPSLPYLPVLVSQIEQEYQDFLDNPAGNADFMTKRMNLPAGNPDYQLTDYDNLKAASREQRRCFSATVTSISRSSTHGSAVRQRIWHASRRRSTSGSAAASSSTSMMSRFTLVSLPTGFTSRWAPTTSKRAPSTHIDMQHSCASSIQSAFPQRKRPSSSCDRPT